MTLKHTLVGSSMVRMLH